MQNELKRLRKAAGLTQIDLAKRIGTTRSQLVKLERGERRLSDIWLRRLAPVLGVSIGEILGDSGALGYPLLPVSGSIMVDGTSGDLPPHHLDARLALPPGCRSEKGVSVWLMGDGSMDACLNEGSLLFFLNPREQYCPILPDSILLVQRGASCLLRQFRVGTMTPTNSTTAANHLSINPKTDRFQAPTLAFDPDAIGAHCQCSNDTVKLDDVVGVLIWELRAQPPIHQGLIHQEP